MYFKKREKKGDMCGGSGRLPEGSDRGYVIKFWWDDIKPTVRKRKRPGAKTYDEEAGSILETQIKGTWVSEIKKSI